MESHSRPFTWAAIEPGAFAAHENLPGGLLGGSLRADGLRPEVRASWERSLRYLQAPAAARPPLLWDDEEFEIYRGGHPMAAVLPVIAQLLVQPSHDTGLLVAIGDQHGRLLWVQGDQDSRAKATRINFVEGADWSEAAVGTSAPGAALATDKSIQIAGAEHFNFGVHQWSCTAVPLHDPDSGSVLGIVDVTGGSEAVARHTLSLVNATVAAAQAELRIQRLQGGTVESGRQARRPARAGPDAGRDSLHILGRDQCVLNLNGRPVKLSERHTEILTVLALNPAGLPADELAPWFTRRVRP
ncbi:hypothetical protein [Arthrobacter sp. A5]|uniref:hypothetical protein n=1 Tax=Arthrobacter sp. A5 TaxID=576926 RepID=UPI003DA8A778